MDTLRLEHPQAPELTLFSDGRVWVLTPSPEDWVAADNGVDQNRFQPFVSPHDWIEVDCEVDQRRFKSFLARIPKPTMLQTFKAKRVEDLWARVIVWTFILVVGLLLVFGWVWRLSSSD